MKELSLDESIKYLKECFLYIPDSGLFAWKVRPAHHFKRESDQRGFNKVHAGKSAGSISNNGYMGVGIMGKRMQVHRLAWFMFYGEWPDCVDHVNGDRTDQRIANLRNVSVRENNRNRAGVKGRPNAANGVYWCSYHQKYRARIKVEGRDMHIGYFSTIEEARTARKQVEIKNGFHPNHGRDCGGSTNA